MTDDSFWIDGIEPDYEDYPEIYTHGKDITYRGVTKSAAQKKQNKLRERGRHRCDGSERRAIRRGNLNRKVWGVH